MDPVYKSNGPDREGVLCGSSGLRLVWELFSPDPAEPAGRMIVLWGAFATSQHFLQEADLLKAHGYEVLLFDHRGVCKSGPCVLEMQSAAMLAQDALELLDHVWPGEAVHVYGGSMGGMVAQELGVLLLQCKPQPRLNSLILSVTCRGFPGGNLLAMLGWAHPLLLRPLVAWWYGNDKRAIVRRLMKKVFTREYMNARHPSGQTYREVYERVWQENFDRLFTFSDHNTTACHTTILLTHWLSRAKVAALRNSGARITVQVSSRDSLVPPPLQHMLAHDLHAHKVVLPIGHMGAHQMHARFHSMFLEHLAAASASAAVARADAATAKAAMASTSGVVRSGTAVKTAPGKAGVVEVEAFAA